MRPKAGEALLVAALLAALFVLAHVHALPPGRVLCTASVLAPEDARARNGMWDQELQFGPWLAFEHRELASGRLPLWNPHAGCGAAHAANDQSAVFHPLTLLAALAGPVFGFFLLALAKHVLAGLGVHFFLRARGLAVRAGLVGAVAFAFSVPFVAWQGYPVSTVLLAFGWGLFAIERAAQGGGPVPFALAVALALLGGHLQTALHVGVAWSAFAAVRALSVERRGRFLAKVGGGALLGGALAAPHLLLFLDELARSEVLARRAASGVRTVLPLRELALLVFPDLDGNPRDGTYGARDIAWIELGEGSVGSAALALAVLGALGPRDDRSARLARGALLLAAVALALVHGAPLVGELERVPPFSLARNHRLTVVVAGALAVAAGAGADLVLRGRADVVRGGCAFALLAALLRAIAGKSLATPPDELARAFRGPFLAHAAPLCAAAGILAVAVAATLAALPRRWNGALLVLVVALALAVCSAGGFEPAARAESFFAETDTTRALERPGERPRAVALGDLRILPPNELTAYGIDDVRRYDVIGSRAFAPLRDALGERGPNPDIETFGRVDARLGRVLGVRDYVFADERLDPRWVWDDLATWVVDWVPLGANVATSERLDTTLAEIAALQVVVRLQGTQGAKIEVELGGRRVEAVARAPLAPLIFRFTPPARGERVVTFRRTDGGRGSVSLGRSKDGRGERSFEGHAAEGPLAVSVAALSSNASSLAVVTSEGLRVVEDRDTLPRVRWVGTAMSVSSAEMGIAELRKTSHDPRTTVIVDGEGGTLGKSGVARLVRYESSRVEVATDGDPGWVVLADAWHPEWRATLDGTDVPILRADAALRAVRVPGGPHTLVFAYKPRALTWGLALATTAVLVLVLGRSARERAPASIG